MDNGSDSSNSRARLRIVLIIVALAITIALSFFGWRTSHGPSPLNETANQGLEKMAAVVRLTPPLPGELILRDYGTASGRPESDLNMMAHALSNLTLLIKGDQPFRAGVNEEFAAALRGKNHTQLRFLPDTHQAFNAQGQVVDRWKSPLFFHAVSHERVDIRSAGPDRQMWTGDDLHRRYNGQFLRDGDLNPKSLFDEGSAKQTGR